MSSLELLVSKKWYQYKTNRVMFGTVALKWIEAWSCVPSCTQANASSSLHDAISVLPGAAMA